MSCCHGSKISGSQLTVVLQTCQKKEKIDIYDFSVHDCTQGQNDSPYFSSIVSQGNRPSLSRNIIECRNFATMVLNVMSHFSSLFFS